MKPGGAKLLSPVWNNGVASYYILNLKDFNKIEALTELIMNNTTLIYFSTWFPIVFLLSFTPLVIWRRTRLLALLLGVLFHFSNGLLMGLREFVVFCLPYLLFVEWSPNRFEVRKFFRL
ncbi:MAG: HTTM domain-containing protein [Bacteriovoracaceae bacterium]